MNPNKKRMVALKVEKEKVEFEIKLLQDRIEATPKVMGNERYKQLWADKNRVIELQVKLRGIEKELELLSPGSNSSQNAKQ